MEPGTEDVLALAAIIREVDGGNRLGAAVLAEAILSHPSSLWFNPSDDDMEGIAHEVWACAHLAPGEGIVDGVDRIVDVLRRGISPKSEKSPTLNQL